MDLTFDPALGVAMSHSAQTHMTILQNFWQAQLHAIEQGELDFKTFQLPLARIKKVMKTDEDVKMISAEAPIIFAKACEIFVLELTLRAWIHTEENKRRTLQRNDVAAAISKTDTFDFLIDIVPREESRSVTKKANESDYQLGGTIDPTTGYYYAPSSVTGGIPQQSSSYGQPMMDMRGNGGMDSMMYYQQQQQQMQQMQYLRQQHMMGGQMHDSVNMMSNSMPVNGNNNNLLDYGQNGYMTNGMMTSSHPDHHIPQ